MSQGIMSKNNLGLYQVSEWKLSSLFLFALSSVFTVIIPNPGSSHPSADSRLCENEMLCRRSPVPASRAFKTNKSVITVSVIKTIWLVSC